MSQLEETLVSITRKINSSDQSLKRVRDWIDGYSGKVVQLTTEQKNYYLVFTKDGVSLRKGEYPSCELTYRGEENPLVKILKGQTSTYAEMKGENLTLWGSLHESVPFEGLIRGLQES